MADNIKWKYDEKRFNAIRRTLGTRLQNETLRAAKKAKTKAKRKSPKDTGALSASVYARSPKFDGYTAAIADSRAKNPSQKPEQELPPIAFPSQSRDVIVAAVDCPLDYGILLEDGHMNPVTGKYHAAKPWFAPAIQDAFPDFLTDLKKALETL